MTSDDPRPEPDEPKSYWVTPKGLPPTDAPPAPRGLGRSVLVGALLALSLVWTVVGGAIWMLMIMALSLEGGGSDTGHSAEASSFTGLWFLGMIIGWGGFLLARRRSR